MKRNVTVEPDAGLHARPASRFVQTANEFESEITVVGPDGESADARSMLAVSGLAVDTGENVTLRAEGPDAEAALDALETVLGTPEEDDPS